MLRISIVSEADDSICLQLEGSLIGPWVGELRRLSEKALGESKTIALDLEKLRYVDLEGAVLLRDLAEKRVAQFNCSPFIRQHLEEGQL